MHFYIFSVTCHRQKFFRQSYMVWRGTHKNTDLTLSDLFSSKLFKHF